MKTATKGGTLNVLSEVDVERIHSASLDLLSSYGVYSESNLILDIFHKAGANIDHEERRIRLYPDMITAALKTAPSSFVFYGREPEYDLQIEPGPIYFGMGGSSEPFYWDYKLGRPRSPTKADMVACTRVGQAASHIDFVMALCSAGDYPAEQVFLQEYDALIRNTTKPILYSCPNRWHTRLFIEMAAVACGGESEFIKRPPIMFFNTAISPLRIGHFSEGMVDAIEFGVPIMITLGPMMGATSPATLAGTLVQINAEALFGIVLTQIIKPGTPVVYGPHVAVMDMTTAQCTYGSAEQHLGRSAVAQLGRLYNLPTFGLGGGVEAKLPDAEAAAQAMMGLFSNALSGLTLTQCLGTLASGLYGSPEMLLICDEMVHMLKHFMVGIQVNDETLALEAIKEVGHMGNFLMHDHTAQWFRKELFFPSLFRRQSIDDWLENGARPIVDIAHARVEQILSKTGSSALPNGADAELDRILSQAVKELKKDGIPA
jgi:trimethylamine---corrinoid protein Co-methyltransferase